MATKKVVENHHEENAMRCRVCAAEYKDRDQKLCCNGCVGRSEDETATLQKLRLSLSGANVDKEDADKWVAFIARLQEEDVFAPEAIEIGAQLIALQQKTRAQAKKRNRDIVAEYCASILRVERIG